MAVSFGHAGITRISMMKMLGTPTSFMNIFTASPRRPADTAAFNCLRNSSETAGRVSSTITLVVTGCLIGLTIYSGSYLVWTVLVLLMLRVMGRHHPRTPDESEPLDPARLWLAGFAAVMMILCFTPVPMSLVGF